MPDLCNLGDRRGELAFVVWTLVVLICCFGLCGLCCGASNSLILRKAEGDGKFVSLLKLTELSLPTDRALLNPLELEVRLPRPRLISLKGGGGGAWVAPLLPFNLSNIDRC